VLYQVSESARPISWYGAKLYPVYILLLTYGQGYRGIDLHGTITPLLIVTAATDNSPLGRVRDPPSNARLLSVMKLRARLAAHRKPTSLSDILVGDHVIGAVGIQNVCDKNTQTGTVDMYGAGQSSGSWLLDATFRVDHHYTARLVGDLCAALASSKHFQPRFICREISLAGLEGLLPSLFVSTSC
jgi:hypothetical protein